MRALMLNVLYLAALAVSWPWLVGRALGQGKYRHGWREKLLGLAPRRSGRAPCVWLHAVSVGEVNLLVPLVRELTGRHDPCEIVISTTTSSGFALAKSRFPRTLVFYCPLDFSWAVRRAMRRIRPDLLVLAELELWPNLIRAAKASGAAVAVVNGRLSDRSFRGYRRIGLWIARVLRQIDVVAAQNQEYAQRFIALGASAGRVHVTGSLKYDNARTDRRDPAVQRLRELACFGPDDIVFLAGSTGDPEEEAVLTAYESIKNAHPHLRLVLVPRHPERFDAVADLLARRGISFCRRSGLSPDVPRAAARVILVDQVGELGAWWGTADIGFVGGSLNSRGGQNMIEPAAFAVATCFGPNTRNFRDVVADLLREDAACVVEDVAALTRFVEQCLVEPDYRCRLGQRARAVVLGHRGASAKTVSLLDPLIPRSAETTRGAV